jgi:hypothetical protein
MRGGRHERDRCNVLGLIEPCLPIVRFPMEMHDGDHDVLGRQGRINQAVWKSLQAVAADPVGEPAASLWGIAASAPTRRGLQRPSRHQVQFSAGHRRRPLRPVRQRPLEESGRARSWLRTPGMQVLGKHVIGANRFDLSAQVFVEALFARFGPSLIDGRIRSIQRFEQVLDEPDPLRRRQPFSFFGEGVGRCCHTCSLAPGHFPVEQSVRVGREDGVD